MLLPPFQVPILGNGLLIAINAITHVIVSHGIAIGLVSMIVLAESIAERRGSTVWRAWARNLTTFSIVVISGVGAVTGVGIWFTTSVLSPSAIGSMLRVFFWPWTLEWLVFVVELIVLLVYHFTWSRWGESPDPRRRRRHRRLGAAYVLLTLVGAALISAILSFMLTPGRWPQEQRLAEAFLNPSYPWQLLFRVALSVHLGALIGAASVIGWHRDPLLQRDALPLLGRIGLGSFVLLVAAAWLFFAMVPLDPRDESMVAILTSRLSQAPWLFWLGNVFAAAIVVGFCLLLQFGGAESRLRRAVRGGFAVAALVAAVALASEFERIREFVRGPYLMPGYMYVNQVVLAERPLLVEEGMLSTGAWRHVRRTLPEALAGTSAEADLAGAFLFAQSCSACHTIGGVNDIVVRMAGRPRDGIDVIIEHAHDLVPFMPPFTGSADERRLVAAFLDRLGRGEVEMASLSRFVPAVNPDPRNDPGGQP